jgi:serine protease Do
MKLLKPAIFSVFFSVTTFSLFAQEDVQSENNTRIEKKKIIIRKNNGEPSKKVTVEVNGDQIMINGKPYSSITEGNNSDINSKMIIINGENDHDENQSVIENIDSVAFLGVTSEKAELGAKIISISNGSAAEKAGLQEGDVITKVNTQSIDGPQSLSETITSHKPNEEVKISFLRNGKEKNCKATLQLKKKIERRIMIIKDGSIGQGTIKPKTKNPLNEEMEMPFHFSMPNFPAEGLDNLEDLNLDINVEPKKEKLGLKIQDTEDGKGVKVLAVTSNSPAEKAGMMQNDIIIGIEEGKVSNTDDARTFLSLQDHGKYKYTIKAIRNGKEMEFELKIPKKLKTADL